MQAFDHYVCYGLEIDPKYADAILIQNLWSNPAGCVGEDAHARLLAKCLEGARSAVGLSRGMINDMQEVSIQGLRRASCGIPRGALYTLFFLSGFPALLYQIVWQRSLFTIYGVNIQAVTVVVSAFMLGLGLGSLIGGAVSKWKGIPLLAVFGLAELGIACFGFFSLRIFNEAAVFTAGTSALGTGFIAFFLLLVPTTFMGGTLPILVAYLVRISGNVGRSVGILYFVNTLGSAAACFCAAYLTMRYLGESGSVNLAASINAVIGGLMIVVYTLNGRGPEESPSDTDAHTVFRASAPFKLFPLGRALLVSGAAGFIALGYEILWYRVYSFNSGGQARAFPLLLGFYLVGIAFGSLLTRHFCSKFTKESLNGQLQVLAGFVLMANLCGYLVIPMAGYIGTFHGYLHSLPFVTLATILLGAIFPLISHVAVSPDERAGSRLSLVYVSNIIGSTLGSFVVGYVLMDLWTLRAIAIFIALAGLGLAGMVLMASRLTARAAGSALASGAALTGMIFLSSGPLFDKIYERLQEKWEYSPNHARFSHIVETKSGVVTVTQDKTIFGGGMYDGRFNTSLTHDTNGLFRPYSISLWHPAPRKVLMIGLSSGSWAQIVASHPQLEKLTIVEINPGYLQLIPQYPEVSSILNNPKIDIVIDDGRRWLVRNPQSRFDVVVDNNTHNWRSHATNLLSMEFLQLVRQHLNPGGVLFYNTTGSGEVQLTGATVFRNAVMVGNCIAVSDAPIGLDWDRWKKVLLEYRIDGRPALDPNQPADVQRLAELTSLPINQPDKFESIEYADSIRRRNAGKRMVTEDNMGTEWGE